MLKEKTLSNWCVAGRCLIGVNDNGKNIRTSMLVSRDGHKVTTISGSVYVLTDPPHPYMVSQECLKLYHEASTYQEAIDRVIQLNKIRTVQDDRT
jgi:hypothetical protein